MVVTALAFVVLALAAYRITRLVTLDSILDAPRDWLVDRAPDGKVAALVACPFCVGWWVSGIVVFVGRAVGLATWPWPELVLWWPAVAGLQGLASAADVRLSES